MEVLEVTRDRRETAARNIRTYLLFVKLY